MKCQDVIELLSPYLDGALEPSEREGVKAHLACCSACRAEWEELSYSVSLLQELPEIAPPTGFRVGLMEKINQLPEPAKAPQPKRWYERISEVTKSGWYRTAAVAAVMAMTLGLTSLWQQNGNDIMPVKTTPNNYKVAEVRENPVGPKDPAPNKTPETNPATGVTDPNTNAPGTNGKPSPEPAKPVVNGSTSGDRNRGYESFVPQPSEGMVATNTTIKLEVQDFNNSLKSIGVITQAGGGSVHAPYSESGNTGHISIRIPMASYKATVNELQKLGEVVSFLPTERDLSSQHKQAKDGLEQLKTKKAELESSLADEQNEELEKQLATVNASLAELVNTIKQLEERSSYAIISMTLI